MIFGVNASKVAISLPAGLLAWVEEQRARRGMSRSEFIAWAVEVERQRCLEDEQAARYAAAYEVHPETDDDTWLDRQSTDTLTAVWSEDPHDWSEDFRLDRRLDAKG